MKDVLFPIWLLMIFPLTWFLVIPAIFVADTVILFLGIFLFKVKDRGGLYKRSILWVFLFGFLSDVSGSIILLLSQLLGDSGAFYEYIALPLSRNPFDNIYSLLYTVGAVIVSGILIYVFNRFISFRKLKSVVLKRGLALLLAIFTAPYLFLVPTVGINEASSETFTNHFVWSDYNRAEVYLYDESETDILETEQGGHYNYEVVTAFRNAVNTAEKSDFSPKNDEWEYQVVFYKIGANAGKLDKIVFYEYGGNLYFLYNGGYYSVKGSYKEELISRLNKHFENSVPDEEIE